LIALLLVESCGLKCCPILGRARRNVLLFDNDNPRNAVTQESHGFLTRDGIKPKEFREIAHKELRDKPLAVIIGDQVQGFHFIQTFYNWSKDLVVLTNGKVFENAEQENLIRHKGIKIIENKIKKFEVSNGHMEKIIFDNGESVLRKGGFVMPQLVQSSDFGERLGCKYNSLGGISVDSFGRTNVQGIYAAGDASVIDSAQIIIAAAEGVRAAAGVNTDLTQKEFLG